MSRTLSRAQSRKKRRLYIIGLGMLALAASTALVLNAFEDNIVFFFSPSDLQAKPVEEGRTFRLGGLVEEGSVQRMDGLTISFRVTDMANVIPVTYTGVVPDLFREGQGVVAQGQLKSGVFVAREVLAKHDETYMPPEVAEALKRAEHWREDTAKSVAQ
ncbi:MAG: cytochrome c maturation protein CcmE [Alphaproteobacteria bacterium]|nr:cytochrome c maturation protein CcmE [Alphaproteobacteria bacterium]MBU0796320.1 cytochrome c maturation protein CcmE [Alphaproteobacteria bacterium]MBU0889163.1 cytochrome c maturation protein CcmE [Alphaproteobacteria bacterium]MBU1812197.1 cytochrome c maturation protein CcmE [Alphaproteobacteria bacterium]